MRNQIIYAVYKGDKFIYMGTKEECAEHLGVKRDTIVFYSSPTYQKRAKTEDNDRMIVIRVEDIED